MFPLRALVAFGIVASLPLATNARERDLEDVREALETTYVHGVTEEIARDLVGSESVTELVAILEDPSFPRHDNVVAFLAHLGGVSRTAGASRNGDRSDRWQREEEEPASGALFPCAVIDRRECGQSA